MAREMDEILRQQIAETANSCTSENGVSFLDHVILPLYDIVAAVSFTMFYENFIKLYNVKSLNELWTSVEDDNPNFTVGCLD